jgi:hypothetical protein
VRSAGNTSLHIPLSLPFRPPVRPLVPDRLRSLLAVLRNLILAAGDTADRDRPNDCPRWPLTDRRGSHGRKS